ncbi:uncharacterized protein BDZ99DRAFT_436189 [Mytilinidion resinicola]|uniref:Nucleoporin Pom152 n=1 Tax=Mytilinidion resinicola TaxID=574789 RepID=A0A6A6YY91_9PEZI|nr:uncharacterized protein BDZ99DRAFT_436189 [Mytilinidion resinicola]KAF2813740.1 hypothetical protein BDZ99DRAFT_436189 [Mytilinidion resinicola]
MSGTPRLRSAFPSTPQTSQKGRFRTSNNGTPIVGENVGTPRKLQDLPSPAKPSETAAPLIPFDIIDAPSQRFYVFSVYVFLFAYRLYDFYNLTVDEVESFWLFMKWVAFDGVFLFLLPAMRIPWLEWNVGTVLLLFFLHATLDGMLMFRIPLPIPALLGALWKVFFDDEMAITEHKVNVGKLLHNSSVILGKQIINILPEGSAVLNPKKEPFCLDSTVHQIQIPIQINQTTPVLIEIMRIDLETMQNETISISASATRKLMKAARKSQKAASAASPLLLHYPVKKTGIYILRKVLDETKLEVQPKRSDVVVVTCPQASVRPTGDSRCRNELSNVALEVEGTPPLRIKYRTTVNGIPREASEFQSLQPEDFVSPLTKHETNALVRANEEDVSWAQSHKLMVPLNETLIKSGKWTYSVEEVQDAVGNIINYVESEEDEKPRARSDSLLQTFTVHERPTIVLDGCDSRNPLRSAKGEKARMPVRYGSTAPGKKAIFGPAHTVEYLFTPEDDVLPNGGHSLTAQPIRTVLETTNKQPIISDAGLYTLKSVSTKYCTGEVLEPATCVLQHPPEPDLVLSSQNITDKCAGSPIGLRVALDLIGTPPFMVHYTEHKKGDVPRPKRARMTSLRGQIDLTPPAAGHYTYTFKAISDEVYAEKSLKPELVLEQDVKPSASAHFAHSGSLETCIDEAASFSVILQGESPWTLEYDLVHSGKRKKHHVKDIHDEEYTIHTEKLTSGGEYTLSLVSITDRQGCKEFLKEQSTINVRHERPKAYFGQIDGKRVIRTLERNQVQLPLKLTGTGPWNLKYKTPQKVESQRIYNANDFITTKEEGIYELLSVKDSICPGSIDENAKQFDLAWVPRPKLKIAETATTIFEGGFYVKDAVCEGDEDSFDVILSGTPPYEVSYEQHFKAKRGGKALGQAKKDLKSALGLASVRTDTSQSGFYEYKFTRLGDNNYDHDFKKFQPVVLQQLVNPRPEARFNNPGKTYSYCSREAEGEEVIPVTFTGVPPFYLEIEIKHHGTSKPETVSFPSITSHSHNLRIPHKKLHLGHSNISIRKVRDARGCTRKPPTSSPRVQISVHDAPSAIPLEDRNDYCVGERLSFQLSGQMPFSVFYTFNGKQQKAQSPGTTFRRMAELPGTFTITGLKDSASECLASTPANNPLLTKVIHPIPSVRLSRGLESRVDIHEGGEAELLFEFTGTAPFEFTYTRSTNARKGVKSKVLEIRTETSYDHSMRIRASEEGTYEVISIKDRWCSFAKATEGTAAGRGQKLLTY